MSDQGINILVLGKTGVGKSSFCNYVFGENIFVTGRGKPVTGWSDHFTHYSVEHDSYTLNVYDSVGIEANNFNKWDRELDGFLNERGHSSSNNPLEWLHGAFYLINAASARIEDIEKDIIKKLAKENNIPLEVILTNADVASNEEIEGVKKELYLFSQKENINLRISEVCSVSIKTRAGKKEQFGKDEMLSSFLIDLDSKLRVSFLKYFIDLYISSFQSFKSSIKNRINDSDLGTLNIIKGIIKDGDNFDLDSLLDMDTDFLDSIFEEKENTLDQLNGFLDSLSFTYDGSISADLDALHERIEEQMARTEHDINNIFESIEDAFSGGSFMDKIKASGEILKLIMNMKSYFNGVIDKMIDPTLNQLYIEKIKLN